MSPARPVSRRLFLVSVVAAAGGVTLLFRLRHAAAPQMPGRDELNLWVQIAADGRVRLRVQKCEMGQGVLTALAMMIAEELEVGLDQVEVEQADADFRFTDQNTSGSSSIIDTWESARLAGAMARLMLSRTAARTWGVPVSECQAERGAIVHQATARKLAYGPLARRVTPEDSPDGASVALKTPREWRLLGTPTRRLDTGPIVRGEPVFGLDTRVPGMLFASVARCPVAGGTLLGADDAAAMAVAGVRRVVRLPAVPAVRLPERIAVVAESTWAAISGRARLACRWDEGALRSVNTDTTIAAQLAEAARATPAVPRNDGDAVAAGVRSHASHVATVQFPYVAHATMEPMNCTARLAGGHIEIWAPTQFPQRAVERVAEFAGVRKDAITLHVRRMGGGFGRRVYPDVCVEAVQIARAVGQPVQTVWTREDDLRQDFYRPCSVHRLSAVTDPSGRPTAWLHEITGPSLAFNVFGTSRFPAEAGEIDGAVTMPYRMRDVRVEYRMADVPVPLGVWRSVSSSTNVFAVETFMDELAHRAGADPVAFRGTLLDDVPRLKRALDLAAEQSGWTATPLRAGRGRGVAIWRSDFLAFVACVAEVTVRPGSANPIRVDRLVFAIDCGAVVNPLTVRAQAEGGAVWALTAALLSRITLKDGRIEQSNFGDYPLLRFDQMPKVEVHIVPSDAAPGGIGEHVVSPVAPAVANAVFAATGTRCRALPLDLRGSGLETASG